VRVGDIICEPDSVDIRGPRVLVQKVDELVTRERRFTRMKNNLEAKLPLQPAFSPKILPQVHHVLVRAKIEALAQTEFDSILIEIINLPRKQQSSISPEFVQVVLEGPQSTISSLDSLSWNLFLDFEKDWDAEREKYIPHFKGPPLLKAVAVIPPEISWEVKKSTTRRRR